MQFINMALMQYMGDDTATALSHDQCQCVHYNVSHERSLLLSIKSVEYEVTARGPVVGVVVY